MLETDEPTEHTIAGHCEVDRYLEGTTMAQDLKCQGRFLDREGGEEVATGWGPDYDQAVTAATTTARKQVDAKVAEALKTLGCPQPYETWHKVRTERTIGRQASVLRTWFLEVNITLKWHLDILCYDPESAGSDPAVE
jgi:hypothetical protein